MCKDSLRILNKKKEPGVMQQEWAAIQKNHKESQKQGAGDGKAILGRVSYIQ